MTININNYFCKEMIILVQDQLENEVIETEILKDHVTTCQYCGNNLKKVVVQFSSPIAIMNLMKGMKNVQIS